MITRNTLNLIYRKLKYIDDIKALNREKLTLCEYRICYDILSDLYKYGRSTTIAKSCADWYRKQGLNVTESEDGVGYVIEAGESKKTERVIVS